MIWVFIASGAWLTLAMAGALLIARGIRIAADRRGFADRAEATVEPPVPTSLTSPGEATGGRPEVRHAAAARGAPRPRLGDHDPLRRPRHRTHVRAVRDPLNAAERIPPTPSGAA